MHNMLARKATVYSTEIKVFCVFALLTAIVTFPVIIHFKTYVYAGLPGDPYAALWDFWWTKISIAPTLSYENCSQIGAPFGIHVPKRAEPVMNYSTLILSLLFGEIAAYNIMVIAGFLLSAITMYYLAHYFTNNKLASAVSGAIFAFSPYHFAQSYAHLGLSNIQWIPLYFLFLFRLYEKRTFRNSLLYGLSFALVVLGNGYYAFFVAIFTIVFIIFIFLYNLFRKKVSFHFRRWELFLLSVVFAFALIAPFIIPVAFQQYTGSTTHITELWEVESLTTSFWNYLLPAPDNLILGGVAEDFIYTKTEGRYPVNITDYLGYVAIALGVLGVIGWWRRRKFIEDDEVNARLGWGVPFLMLAFFTAIIISAHPSMKVFGSNILMPSYYLHEIAPMFRAFARFGIIAMLALSVLAGLGVKRILDMIRNKSTQVIIVAVLTVMMLVEFINVPPSKASYVGDRATPAVYQWLAGQEGDFTIAEYPAPALDWHIFYKSQFYQRVHKKKLADVRNIPSIEYKDYLYNPSNPGVVRVLEYLGVRYVIMHTDQYRNKEFTIPEIQPGTGLKIIKSFPNTLVYEVAAKPSKVFWVNKSGQFSPEFWSKWDDYSDWKWALSEIELIAVNCAGRDSYGDLKFDVASLGYDRRLVVYVNGRLLKEVVITPNSQTIVIEDALLKTGENSVRLTTDSKCDQINSYLHNGDVREAAFRFTGFEHEN